MRCGVEHRRPGFDQPVHQQVGQKKRGKVIDLKGLLEAIDGAFWAVEHAARVVGEHVDPRILLE